MLFASDIIDRPNKYLGKHVTVNSQKGVLAGIYLNKWVLVRLFKQFPDHLNKTGVLSLGLWAAKKINDDCNESIFWFLPVMKDTGSYYWVWISREEVINFESELLTQALKLIEKELK